MSTHVEKRQLPDRRSRSRGGRRPTDRGGATPLILVADEESQSLEMCEAILAKLHFAVAPVNSVEKAVAVGLSTEMPAILRMEIASCNRFTPSTLPSLSW